MGQEKTLEHLEELLEQLRDDQLVGYGPTAIPGSKDFVLMELIDALLLASSETRCALLKKIGDQYQFAFPGFAERLSSYAVRLNDPDVLKKALLALALISGGDGRETLITLSLVVRSAKKLKLDLRTMLQGPLIDESFRKTVSDFLMRPPQDQSIAAMGFKEGHDSDGFRYERNW